MAITDPALARLHGPTPGPGNTLRYPLNLGDGSDVDIHWIQFIVYRTTGARMESTLSNIANQQAQDVAGNTGITGGLATTAAKLSAAGLSAVDAAQTVVTSALMRSPKSIVNPTIGGVSFNNKERDLTTRELTKLTGLTSSIGKSIQLYFPGEYKTHYAMDYAAEDLTQAANLGALLGGGESNTQAVKEIAYQFGASKVSDLAGGAAKKLGIDGLSSSLQTDLSAVNRQVANPLVELLFKQVEFRTFSFNFTFRPTNQAEEDVVNEIIQTFVLYAHPHLSSSGGRFLDFPGEFDINFMVNGQENMKLRRISRCVISKIDIVASPEKQAMLKSSGQGSSPVVTNLSLTFQEVNKLDASLIEKGY